MVKKSAEAKFAIYFAEYSSLLWQPPRGTYRKRGDALTKNTTSSEQDLFQLLVCASVHLR